MDTEPLYPTNIGGIMEGGYKPVGEGDAVGRIVKEVECLRREIKDLTEKKSNLQNEINTALNSAREQLEKEYQKKVSDLEVTYQSKLNVLQQEKESNAREIEVFRKKDADLKAGQEKLSADIKALEEMSSRSKKEFDDAVSIRDKAEKDALVDKTRLKALEEKILKDEIELKEKIRALDQRELDLNTLSDRLAKESSDLAESQRKNSAESERLANLGSELSKAKETADANLAYSVNAKIESEAILREANGEREDLDKTKKEIETQRTANSMLSESLSDLRDSLNEKDKTLKEKEKLLVLKERDIDGKISTLKKLRGE